MAEAARDPRSGVQDDGTWVPAFEGQRPPVHGEPGNQLARRHGGFSLAQLDGDVAAIAVELRDAMGALAIPRFDLAIEAAAAVGALWFRARAAIAETTAGGGVPSDRLMAEENRFAKRWDGALARLGLQPDTASKISANLADADAARRRALLDQYRLGDVVDGQAVEDGEAAA